MDTDTLDLLHARRAELAERLDRIHRDRTQADGPVSPDFADQAQQRENDEVLDRLEPSTAEQLRQFEHAIQRAESGAYGICEVCGEPIDMRRLALLPQATACTACAEAA
ncbi:TraR/DksA family transcriptional regulator [Sinimarinibacterium sp. CAU 1509]|uniref:TraR/DksA family transcriptional regulator n=1 Tax=Sinimarinibacterium sp. CAU 1509 TaxID=2562283 RepID=UPI0010AC9E80|nr:TraR/DksA family transcriptional regulator [Sinimarinibacterium sp. CAU 1509]TJY63002.1 TraR/DksA family transcriptional regulator [Sinimarinibacterium sp. CAU 1509]